MTNIYDEICSYCSATIRAGQPVTVYVEGDAIRAQHEDQRDCAAEMRREDVRSARRLSRVMLDGTIPVRNPGGAHL